MKILLVHNFYGSSAPSGENAVFLAESELLRSKGHRVIEFTRHSDEIRHRGVIGTIQGAIATPWNPFSFIKLRHLLEEEQPDIMHVHNTFPLLSPSVFYAAQGIKTATILTMHNYRMFCASGILMCDNAPCIDCIDRKSVLPALKHGCYRKSRFATIPIAVKIALHRKLRTWERHVDAFIALTGFQKEKMVKAGIPSDVVYVKPNFYSNPPAPMLWDERENKAIFIGRLGLEKGVQVLIEAWKTWGHEAPILEIVGGGPEGDSLINAIKRTIVEQKVVFRGQLPFEDTQRSLARARLLVLPSICFEGFPMAIREAFAFGVPVAASNIGSIPYIVTNGKNGILFEPGDAADLLREVKNVWCKPIKLFNLAKAAREEFDNKYTDEINYQLLMDIYEKASFSRKNKDNNLL
ncbi:MAG: glycosyltransferase family 4 protein [Planctomycetota bacterium]|nr:glycosyltransferase family 4 protein [Planctomycetota bacterium]